MMWPFAGLIEQAKLARLKYPERIVPVLDSHSAHTLAGMALEIAYKEIGHGEVGGNNKGPAVARYCAPHGDGHLWCAGFFGWAYEEAARALKYPMPFRRSLRARTLAVNMAAAGRRFTDYRDAEPGDAMIIGRGGGGHHIAMVARVGVGELVTVEGNHEPKVCETRRNPNKMPGLWFASLRR